MKRHDLGHGINVTTYDPPADFDPLKATSAALRHFGFPQFHADTAHEARFRRILDGLGKRFHYIRPTFRVNLDRAHGPRKAGQAHRGSQAGTEQAGAETSTNWSGAVVFAPAGDSVAWVQGDWVIPDVGAPTQNQWYYAASWIGIDGDGSGDVCQAGVECEVYDAGGGAITRNIYPWWEWFPNGEVQITNFAVSPGDMVTMLICTSGAGANSASLFVTNRTTGASTSLTFTAPDGTTLAGNSAEWIVEAPTVNGSQSALADYGQVFFTDCSATTAASVSIGGGTGDTIELDANGAAVSTGTLVTSSIVQCQYVGTIPSD